MERRWKFVADWPTRGTVNLVIKGSNLGRDSVRVSFFTFYYFYYLFNFFYSSESTLVQNRLCLFYLRAVAEISAHVKDHMPNLSTRNVLKADGTKTHR